MRPTLRVLLALAGVAACFASEPPRIVEAEAGVARVDHRGGSPARLEPRAAFESRAANERCRVPTEHDPWSTVDTVRYGFLGHERGRRVTFAVRVEGAAPPQVLADENVNCDLRDDAVHTAVETDRRYRVDLRLRDPAIPLELSFDEDHAGRTSEVVVLEGTLREGQLAMGGRAIAFAVAGTFGRYGEEWLEVCFDTNGDGNLDLGQRSDEMYVIGADEYVNLAGRSWSFEVSPDGARLMLTALDEARPDRPRLAPGNPAPDFTFTDLDGAAGRLSDYRGKAILLYLWGTWCGPCAGETPHLREAYERFHDRGFEILAIAKEDTADAVRTFAAQAGMRWRHVVEARTGPILTLYRGNMIPYTLLIDRHGTIVAHGMRGASIAEEVARLMEAERGLGDPE